MEGIREGPGKFLQRSRLDLAFWGGEIGGESGWGSSNIDDRLRLIKI